MRFLRHLVLLAALPSLAAAQDVHYAVTIDPARQVFRVREDFPVPAGRDTFLLSLPAWTAGSYGIENYARYVRHFEAHAGDPSGRTLTWDKLDKDTWRIATGGATTVSVLLDTNPDTLNLTYSVVQPDFAFFNGTNLFLYPEGTDYQFAADLAVTVPEGWRVATGLTQTAPGRFRADNYHDLVDAPFFTGRFWLDSITVDGRQVRFAAYPETVMNPFVWRSISTTLQGVVRTQNQIMGGPPYDAYTVLMYVSASGIEWAGGLEHHNSQFDQMPAAAFSTPQGVLGDFTRPLLSHEFFHLWNVKRIRPAELWPYDYSHEQFTPLLWWSEGVTDYYSDLTLVRSGLWTVDRFMMSVSENMSQVEDAREPVAAEDASIDTWIEPTWVEESQYYYPKGSLIGLMLDIQIRDATSNRHNLDDVMRRLYTDFYQRGRGFTTQDLLGLIRPWFPGVDDFYARYINGREPLPYAQVFGRAGMTVSVRNLTGKLNERRRILIASRDPNASASAAAMLASITGTAGR